MIAKAALRAEAARLMDWFAAQGAQPIEADVLQPAETLLDLYGEDIRARAYVTHDPLRGEMMLRPDFTVPVVQMHMSDGAEPARYTYAGEVFRAQEDDADRPTEYFQVGYEVFDGADPAAADAEVFAHFNTLLSPLNLRATTGDIGILMAAVRGLRTSDRRKEALLRHIWRPRRFRALLERFRGRSAVPPTRARMLTELAKTSASALCEAAQPHIGLRSTAEIEDRLTALQLDASEPPISDGEAELLDILLDLRETMPNALEHLRDIAVDVPSILPVVDQMAARVQALSDHGIDVSDLDFDCSHGRTSLEYYDGFVFGFTAPHRPDLPPIATGGRYDALTRVLGQGRSIPAVGGVIRPALIAELGGLS